MRMGMNFVGMGWDGLAASGDGVEMGVKADGDGEIFVGMGLMSSAMSLFSPTHGQLSLIVRLSGNFQHSWQILPSTSLVVVITIEIIYKLDVQPTSTKKGRVNFGTV